MCMNKKLHEVENQLNIVGLSLNEMTNSAVRSSLMAKYHWICSRYTERAISAVYDNIERDFGAGSFRRFCAGDDSCFDSIAESVFNTVISRDDGRELKNRLASGKTFTMATRLPMPSETILYKYTLERVGLIVGNDFRISPGAAFVLGKYTHKTFRDFRASTGISDTVWSRIMNSDDLRWFKEIGEGTARTIAERLGADKEDIQNFLSLLIRSKFSTAPAKELVVKMVNEACGGNIEKFCRESYIDKNAWRVFTEDKETVTTRATLLKLVIALGLTADEAVELLEKFGCIPVTRRDLVVLACLRAGIYSTSDIYEILNVYLLNHDNEANSSNLYPQHK